MLKKIIVSTFTLLFLLTSFIAWGLYLMEIEDHYGDLQEVYFESKSGDLIINKKTKNLGIISKNWKRANIITKQKDTLDLYDFLHESKYEVFKSEKDFDLNSLTFEKIIKLKNERVIESFLNNLKNIFLMNPLILIILPFIFQIIAGRKAIDETISLKFGTICLISFISQIILSIASYSLASYNLNKYYEQNPSQFRCGMGFAGLIIMTFLFTFLLFIVMIIQYFKKNSLEK